MPNPQRIAIIGAGISGLACAEALSANGHNVELFDKGRGPGGRMSTRRVMIGETEIGFDHGAQYFTARAPSFRAEVEAWHRQRLVTPWPAAGDDAWVGAPAMNAPLADLASRLKVRFSARVEGLVKVEAGWQLTGDNVAPDTYDTVIVAVPAEQVSPLIIDHCPGFARLAQSTPSAPCWTVMVAFDQPLAIQADILRPQSDIVWAARNNSKPGRASTEAWVIQASPEWSHRHQGAAPPDVTATMLEAFRGGTSLIIPSPVFTQAHSWLYAKSGRTTQGHLWDASIRLGVCGDWLMGPRVECGWLSGRSLANAMSVPSPHFSETRFGEAILP